MKIFKVYAIFKRSAGEARWCKYSSLSEKFAVFKTLFLLRYYSEIAVDPHRDVSVRIFGYKVTGLSHKEILYLFREIFLHPHYNFAGNKTDPAILDCGANIGMAVLYFKMRYPNCRIVAYEPNPRAFDCLRRNIQDNNLQHVEIINAGLSDKAGSLDFYVDEKNSLISSLDKNRAGSSAIKVNLLKLSDMLRGRKFDFAKIDIEGAEHGVVSDLNAEQVIQNAAEYIFEYHHNMRGVNNSLSDFLRVFEQNNFQYNLACAYSFPGEYQDIVIHFSHKG
jgi:FkbM family methyltransferase